MYKKKIKYIITAFFAAFMLSSATPAIGQEGFSSSLTTATLDATATVPEPVLLDSELFDAADSKKWIGHNRGAETTVSWTVKDNNPSLKVEYNDTENDGWGIATTDWIFYNENWSGYTGMRADVYVDAPQEEIGIKLEISHDGDPDPFNAEIEAISEIVDTGGWVTIGWKFDTAAHSDKYENVTALKIVGENLAEEFVTVYLSNMRLYDGEGEYTWDKTAYPGFRWLQDFAGSDAVDWYPEDYMKESLHFSKDFSTPVIQMAWDNNKNHGEAKVDASGFNLDLSTYTHISANINISCTDSPVAFFFFSDEEGAGGTITESVTLDSVGEWHNVEFNLPSDFDHWKDISAIAFLVFTDSGETTGTVYMDDIYFLEYDHR